MKAELASANDKIRKTKQELDELKGNISVEPRREKTGLRGFRPGSTQFLGLYSHRSRLEALNL